MNAKPKTSASASASIASSSASSGNTPAAAGGSSGEGRLEWRTLLHWLQEDGLIDEAQVLRTEGRFAAGDSSLHPLVRLGHGGLTRSNTGKPLSLIHI